MRHIRFSLTLGFLTGFLHMYAAGQNAMQQAYLKASNTGTNDGFGSSVAVWGDTVAIGAPYEDSSATGVNGNQTSNNGTNSGAVYVFVRNGTNWTQQAYLKASNTGVSDFFGQSLALSGDTLVVGAPGEDSNATGVNGNQTNNTLFDSGAVYIFVREGTNWRQQAYLKASNSGQFDAFGYSVAASGDTVLIGAPYEDSNATGVNGDENNNSAQSSGAAYVFVRTGTNWTQQAYLKASNTGPFDSLGWAVALSENTAAVAAPFEASNATGVNGNQTNNSAADSGAAYVFVRSGTTWSQQAYLKASNTDAGDLFGVSVAASTDTIVIAAPSEDSNATGANGNQNDNSADASGAAYVFARNGTNWSQQTYLKASNTGSNDLFGSSAAISGNTIAIAAPGEDSNATGLNGNESDNTATNSGAAYVFIRDGTNWNQQAYVKASNTQAGDSFGAVTAAGDIVVIGAVAEDSNATGVNGNQANNGAGGSGAAYVFIGFDAAPQLAIERSDSNVQISWSVTATGFVLDETSALSTPAATMWSQVPFPYETNGTRISLTVSMPSGSKFYRLRKP